MPRGDRTGPLGGGPMTGRQMGYCADEDATGYGRRCGGGRGRGQGRVFGGTRGMAFRHGGAGRGGRPGPGFGRATVSRDADVVDLRAQIDGLEAALAELRQRLDGANGEARQ